MLNVRVAAGYLILQGVAALAWWIAIVISPEFRAHFFPVDWGDAVWMAIAIPDLVVYVGGSFAAAVLVATKSRHALWVLGVHLGGACYATLFCIGVSVFTGVGVIGTAVMLVSVAVLTTIVVARVRGGSQ